LALGAGLALYVSTGICSRLTASTDGWWTDAWTIGWIHLLALIALCLYSLGSACMAITVGSCRLASALEQIRDECGTKVWPAAEAIGKAFCLYGILVIAVPLASLMPGSPSLGHISWLYLALVVGLFAFQVYARRKQVPL
jgi:hypothetical protein